MPSAVPECHVGARHIGLPWKIGLPCGCRLDAVHTNARYLIGALSSLEANLWFLISCSSKPVVASSIRVPFPSPFSPPSPYSKLVRKQGGEVRRGERGGCGKGEHHGKRRTRRLVSQVRFTFFLLLGCGPNGCPHSRPDKPGRGRPPQKQEGCTAGAGHVPVPEPNGAALPT